MGKLVYFELRKSLGSRFFLVLLCAALAVHFLLQCGAGEYAEYLAEVTRVGESTWSGIPKESFWAYFRANRSSARYQREMYGAVAKLSDTEKRDALDAMRETYGEAALEDPLAAPNGGIDAVPGYFEGISDRTFLLALEETARWNAEVDAAVGGVLEAAASLRAEAEAQGDRYEVRRNGEILRLYGEVRGAVTDGSLLAGDVLSEGTGMLFVFLTVLLTAAPSVAGERERGTWMLLAAAQNGGRKTFLAKLIAGWITAAGLTAGFQAVTLLGAVFRGRNLGLGQPLAALEALRLCPFSMAVWQYFLLALSMQALSACIFSALVTAVSAFCRSGVLAFGIGALLLGGGLLLLYFPPKSPWLWGPLSLAAPCRYFSGYLTCNVFGQPVLWAAVQAALWTGIALWAAVLAGRAVRREGRPV